MKLHSSSKILTLFNSISFQTQNSFFKIIQIAIINLTFIRKFPSSLLLYHRSLPIEKQTLAIIQALLQPSLSLQKKKKTSKNYQTEQGTYRSYDTRSSSSSSSSARSTGPASSCTASSPPFALVSQKKSSYNVLSVLSSRKREG